MKLSQERDIHENTVKDRTFHRTQTEAHCTYYGEERTGSQTGATVLSLSAATLIVINCMRCLAEKDVLGTAFMLFETVGPTYFTASGSHTIDAESQVHRTCTRSAKPDLPYEIHDSVIEPLTGCRGSQVGVGT